MRSALLKVAVLTGLGTLCSCTSPCQNILNATAGFERRCAGPDAGPLDSELQQCEQTCSSEDDQTALKVAARCFDSIPACGLSNPTASLVARECVTNLVSVSGPRLPGRPAASTRCLSSLGMVLQAGTPTASDGNTKFAEFEGTYSGSLTISVTCDHQSSTTNSSGEITTITQSGPHITFDLMECPGVQGTVNGNVATITPMLCATPSPGDGPGLRTPSINGGTVTLLGNVATVDLSMSGPQNCTGAISMVMTR